MFPPTTCPKCQGAMTEGFIVPRLPPLLRWASGKPETTFLGDFKTKGRDVYPIQTFRCSNCGYLESYAR